MVPWGNTSNMGKDEDMEKVHEHSNDTEWPTHIWEVYLRIYIEKSNINWIK